ncbi:MAG: phosphate/phosphite/phosphonate ABC transporter substrate-binding protein [Pseudonocardiales bacterium]
MRRPTQHTVAALFAAVATLLIASGCVRSAADDEASAASDDPQVLIFATVPSHRPDSLQQDHQPIIEMLEKETGKEILFQTGTDYAAVIKGLLDRKIDIADLGAFSYVLARQRGAQITAVVARVDKKNKPPGYQAYGITWAGSSIQNLADFRGKKVCFVDPDSTSGYLYPSAGLLAVGIAPEKDTIPIFAGRHDASALAVANRQCDAGFALDQMIDRQLIEQGLLQPGQVTTVWKSEPIPDPPLVIADHLDPELRELLTTVLGTKANADYLRANGFCQGECAIADGFAYGYQPTTDAAYDSVREVCRVTQNKSCTEG